MNKYLAYLAGLLIIFSISGLYFYDLGKKSVKATVIDRVEVKTETKIEYVDRLTTRTIKGDTVTEVIHERGKTEFKTIEVEKSTPVKSRYSVSAFMSYDSISFERSWQAHAGARLGDLPLFLEIGATSQKDALLGVRMEF